MAILSPILIIKKQWVDKFIKKNSRKNVYIQWLFSKNFQKNRDDCFKLSSYI